MQTITLARHAMATRFETVLHGADAAALRAAGEEALDEIDRLENQLSLYRPGSEIARLNARAAREPVRVSPELFALLQQAQRLHAETDGAFDITIAPLVRCWGFMGEKRSNPPSAPEGPGAGWSEQKGRVPSDAELAAARAVVGMARVQLDAQHRTVRFAREGVMLDLGAIGKGYAVERATNILREAGVISGLLHGGTSTVCAIGAPPDADFWNVAIDLPKRGALSFVSAGLATSRPRKSETSLPVTTIPLRDESLSVSAASGRQFRQDGKTYGHVIDPRTGRPAKGAQLAAVVLPSATEADALSTALLTLGRAGHERIAGLRPGLKALLITGSETE